MYFQKRVGLFALAMTALLSSACAENAEKYAFVPGHERVEVVGNSLLGREKEIRMKAGGVPPSDENDVGNIAILWAHYPGLIPSNPNLPAEAFDNHYDLSPAKATVQPDGTFLIWSTAPPPEFVLQGCESKLYDDYGLESRYAYALVVALHPGAMDDSKITDDEIAGIAQNHAVLFVESDIRPDTYGELKFHGRLGKGFHLIKAVRTPLNPNAGDPACFRDGENWSRCDPGGLSLSAAPGGFNEHVVIEPYQSGTKSFVPFY